ncbi:G4 quadruplex nucleic acid binding protein [Sporothrix eucalyptigena]|uniref:G4 quadruplex nucleic acid binding protein n=1 Tax=Sporothrix eucalyptigena TaxID=1812306 RepID=A0ABP0CGH4_9PEZI
MAAIASQTYTPAEEEEVKAWSLKALSANYPGSAALGELNAHLATRTTILGAKPSKADVVFYKSLAPLVKEWTPEQRTGKEGHPNIVRLVDYVQNSPAVFGVEVADADKIAIDADEVLYVAPPVDAKAEKERLKKEKAAAVAAAAGGAAPAAAAAPETKALPDRTKKEKKEVAPAVDGAATAAAADAPEGAPTKKKEKKEKQARPPKAAPPPPAPPSPSLIDLRVGHILKAVKHPEADSLYVSTIAMGDAKGTPDTDEYDGQVVRTVCSGLNGLVPLEEMQGRRVVVVCNLKPVKMRGIKSAAMVLAASPRLKEGEEDHHGGPVELVNPPADAPAGAKVFFEGWKGEPEGQLNPKKKVWEMFQPGFTTTDDLEVGFDAGVVKELGKEGLGKLVTESGGVCTVKSLKGATVR